MLFKGPTSLFQQFLSYTLGLSIHSYLVLISSPMMKRLLARLIPLLFLPPPTLSSRFTRAVYFRLRLEGPTFRTQSHSSAVLGAQVSFEAPINRPPPALAEFWSSFFYDAFTLG